MAFIVEWRRAATTKGLRRSGKRVRSTCDARCSHRTCTKRYKNTMREHYKNTMREGRDVLPPFLLRYPHFLEAGQAGQNAGAAKHAVAAIFWRADLDLHGGGCKPPHVLFEAFLETRIHGCATADDDVVVKVLRRG